MLVLGKELFTQKLLDKNGGNEEELEIDLPLDAASAKQILGHVGSQNTTGLDAMALLRSCDTHYTMRHHTAALMLSQRMKENMLRRIRQRAERARESVRKSHAN